MKCKYDPPKETCDFYNDDECVLDKCNEDNKCRRCVWGKLVGIKYFCMLPRCVKDIFK